MCHQPLYFQEINLERYGHNRLGPFQPIYSGVHFFSNVLILPYRMVADHPHECDYTLGQYRPGSCVPFQVHWLPLRPEAGVAEAGIIIGLLFLIP